MSKNPKDWEKLMKIANIDKEILQIFWTTWGNSMKFSGKMFFEIILKLEDKFFEKPRMGSIWSSPQAC